ncbi:MAG: hypothetical protein LBF97_00455, partial [Elusimicrobiota bacterium]|nr:hypothetical protein [Elusimicrobiota bacterium]
MKDKIENKLYYGDNLEILKKMSIDKDFFKITNGGIDLIYIDPPFNSNRNYNILYQDLIRTKENGDKNIAQKEAFSDTWSNIELSQELDELKSYTDIPDL